MEINILALLPALVGGIVAIACTWRLINDPKHPNQILTALIIGAAVSASSVFSDFTLDGGGVKWTREGAKDVVASAVTNTESIIEVRDQLAKLAAEISERIDGLDQKVALAAARPQSDPGSTGSPTTLLFPKDSEWGNIKNSALCMKYPALCGGITVQGNSVQVPKSSFDTLWKFDAGALPAPDYTVKADELVNNGERLDNLLKQFDADAPQPATSQGIPG